MTSGQLQPSPSQAVDSHGNEAALTVEQAIANLTQVEDTSLRYYAAWWLGRFRVTEPAAISALVLALDDESDRAPDGGYPLRRNAIRALGKLGQQSVVPDLIRCLDCPDYYVREAAVQALESLADRQCLPALVELLEGGVATATLVPGKPHLVQPYTAVLEALGTLGSRDIAPLVEPFLQHPLHQVQSSAARAMYQLTREPYYAERLIETLSGQDLQLRRSALMDLGAIGYLPAAAAVASAHAENSLKLIALKNILDHQLDPEILSSPEGLSEAAVHVMTLMDSLL